MDALDRLYPLQRAACRHGRLTWREAGAGPALVLLHGIGSGALSWAGQLEGFAATHRVLAWDAPGYGESDPLREDEPYAADYAGVLAEWLDAAGVREPAVLVGHSLGALVAAAWAAQAGDGLRLLALASPARGYGRAAPGVQQAKWQERCALVERLGPEGMAGQRAAALCAPGAAAGVVEQVRRNMARTTRRGYAQAAHMLAYDDLLDLAATVRAPVAVLCGEHDVVTPPMACEAAARALGASFELLPGVAHACYVEDPPAFNAALARASSRHMPRPFHD